MDLLKQCRESCADLPDAIKFVVPTERKTRSHGANRMVTETKTKYQGYVFAKLRLCPEVYETIQNLDLCRSWMGTVNHIGHQKLPPAPVALNELEVENFGLEECPDTDEEDEELGAELGGEQAEGDVILDSEANDEKMDPKLDHEAIKAYLGLKVEDMVKVTAKGKFFNEDGIVRRLKDGKIFVRFYTYGTMFEEWLDPSDVRPLSNMEILKGLSGPSEPVTQRDFEQRDNRRSNRPYGEQSDGELRRNLLGGGGRNRRQDRNERQYRGGNDKTLREEANWNWYQDQQRSRRSNDYSDGNTGFNAGSRHKSGNDWAVGNVDSQWGRGQERRPPRKNDRNAPRANNRQANREASAAIDGDGDWSAFVSSGTSSNEDDFFSSLMSDIDKSQDTSSSDGTSSSDDDDFFDSLLSDLKSESSSPPPPKKSSRQPQKQQSSEDSDFFASLEAELGSVDSSNSGVSSEDGISDDFFAQLEAELSPVSEKKPSRKPKKEAPPPPSSADDDFFASLESEMGTALNTDDTVFAGLEDGDSTNGGGADDADATFWNDLVDDDDATASTVSSLSSSSNSKSTGSSSSSSSSGDLSKHTVPKLKEMLRERGLKVSGKKSELIERLQQSA